MGGLSRRAATTALRGCCSERGCYKRAHLRSLTEVPEPMVRVLMAELSACEAGLHREDMIKIACRTAKRDGTVHLALQSLREMEHRRMKPSLVAHNALLRSYGRLGRWSQA